jgi:hypothetical protein
METAVQKSWLALRGCWAELTRGKTPATGDEPLFGDLQQRHIQALKALVAGDELSTAVAEKVEVAFGQMLAHKEGLMGLCYFALPVEYWPRQGLMEQIVALEEMAGKGDIDPATVAQVRASSERGITWLARFQAGENPGDVTAIEVEATSAEAARVLVEMLGRGGG